jgi:hypothetical protein
VICGCVAISYFFFIARNRNNWSTLAAIGRANGESMRYSIGSYNDEDLGAIAQLVYYGTHEFTYIDAYVRHGEWLGFRPAGLFGMRVTAQINRFVPAFVPEAKKIGVSWMEIEGLSEFGWPSIFGVPIPIFGLLGSMLFFCGLGTFAGWVMRGLSTYTAIRLLYLNTDCLFLLKPKLRLDIYGLRCVFRADFWCNSYHQ